MTSPPVLGYPNSSDLFILDTDASDYAIGAALSQVQDAREVPIFFCKQGFECKTETILHYTQGTLGRRGVRTALWTLSPGTAIPDSHGSCQPGMADAL